MDMDGPIPQHAHDVYSDMLKDLWQAWRESTTNDERSDIIDAMDQRLIEHGIDPKKRLFHPRVVDRLNRLCEEFDAELVLATSNMLDDIDSAGRAPQIRERFIAEGFKGKFYERYHADLPYMSDLDRVKSLMKFVKEEGLEPDQCVFFEGFDLETLPRKWKASHVQANPLTETCYEMARNIFLGRSQDNVALRKQQEERRSGRG